MIELTTADEYKFVDPDGYFCEPALDLGIIMRDWNDDLLGGDAVAFAMARCERLSQLSGVPPRPIWQWGFVERVSTGLYMLQLQVTDAGRATLAVADLLTNAAVVWGR